MNVCRGHVQQRGGSTTVPCHIITACTQHTTTSCIHHDKLYNMHRSESTQIVQLAYRTGPFIVSASIDQTGKE
eukprot:scaffold4356_cov82-Skeletonema_dohrnii-CCMP3373.AAC.1